MGATELTVVTMAGRTSGPRVALLGGVHGDEEEGVLAVQRLVMALPSLLHAGEVVAVPVANPSAFAAATRESPLDGQDLARVFPGRRDGTNTERLAHRIDTDVIAKSDLVIDLHSAGRSFEAPLMCGYCDNGRDFDDASRAAAIAFAAPYVWAHLGRPNPGRSTTAAYDRAIPSIYAESPGGGRLHDQHVDTYVTGVLRVLASLGMVDPLPPRQPTLAWIGGHGDIDTATHAVHHGRFVSNVVPGDLVESSTVIGTLVDDSGTVVDTVRAGSSGTVYFVRRTARVRIGDLLYGLAPAPIPFEDFQPALEHALALL